ncbi:MAG: ribosome silencing factor [Lacipirellulaceae bacterium]
MPPVALEQTTSSTDLLAGAIASGGPLGPSIERGPSLPAGDPRQAARALELALAAAETAHENRGTDIVVLDMRHVTPVFDYFVIATGSSRRQLHAISEEIDHRLEQGLGDRRMGIEGYAESRWILLDYGSVVIHMFDDETRTYYALEDLWTDAERVPLPWDRPESAQG